MTLIHQSSRHFMLLPLGIFHKDMVVVLSNLERIVSHNLLHRFQRMFPVYLCCYLEGFQFIVNKMNLHVREQFIYLGQCTGHGFLVKVQQGLLGLGTRQETREEQKEDQESHFTVIVLCSSCRFTWSNLFRKLMHSASVHFLLSWV